ncbi:putative mitochondrial dicarboxylate protein [Coleophoma cylindrospora]|uniref:Putative mitochondrial dicarboxylate protein n=1 Tax=Coleophoma cylindrospora TaxID=1849047 RepID=A0A3D8S7J0_9HELO|nr:putative mitochondrial dicarboxylate protein [Coleophoma cylindrospora]
MSSGARSQMVKDDPHKKKWERGQVRLQTRSGNAPKTMVTTFVHVLKHDGFLGLYSGLSASLLRQITYSTTRFAVYEELKQALTTKDSSPTFPTLIAMASASGFLGGIVGNPADVLNVRMQHDAALPKQNRRNYKNAVDGLVRMTREEGWKSLFRGVWPNSMRAVLMTTSQLASYDGFKRLLVKHTPLEDGLALHFSASFMAGFVATTICSPVDVIKTRIMSSNESKGLAKLLTDVYRAEGVAWMFRGWVPSFVRLGPHTIATFLFLEQHKTLYRKLKGIDEVMVV